MPNPATRHSGVIQMEGAASADSGTMSNATMHSISPAVKLSSKPLATGDSRFSRLASKPPKARPPTPVIRVRRMINTIGDIEKTHFL